jgi:hypothetical protein
MYQIGDVLISDEVLTERFVCDLEKCMGACCIEGDAGAPVDLDEIMQIEEALPIIWDQLSIPARKVINKQGVAYTDIEGQLVTSIVNNKDCVFTCYEGDCCLCALEKAYRAGKTKFVKPISCALYPIREKKLAEGLYGLNYHKWKICQDAVKKGQELDLPVYKFLEGPLVRRFGQAWYDELCEVANELKEQGYI